MNSLLKNSRILYALSASRNNCLKLLCSSKFHALTSYRALNIKDVRSNIINFNLIGKMSTLDCPSAEHKPKNLIAEHILNMKSHDEVLNYLGSIDQNLLNENHVLTITNQIFKLYYADLWTRNSDLHMNINISYVQLILQNDIADAMRPLREHEHFPILCKLLNDYADALEIGQVIDTLRTMIYLNFSYQDPVFSKFHSKLMNNMDSISISHFIPLSYILKGMPGLHYDVTRKLIKRLKLIIESNEFPTAEEVNCIVVAIPNLVKLITEDTLEKIMEWLNNSISTLNFNGNPDLIIHVLKFISMCQIIKPSMLSNNNASINILVNIAHDNLPLFEYLQLQDLCRLLKGLKRFDSSWSMSLESRINELFNDNLRPCEIVSLMSSISPATPTETVRKFEDAFISSLSKHNGNMNVLLLSTMADNLLDYHCKNDDVIKIYQKHIAANSSNIVAFISRFNKIAKVLTKKPFVSIEDENMFVKELLKYLEGSHGASLITSTCLGLYLLTMRDYEQIPNHLYLKLFKSLSHWDLVPLTKLLNGLNNRMKDTRDNRHFVELSNRVQQIIACKLASSPKDTMFLLGTLKINSDKILNPSLLQNVVNNFCEISENLDNSKMGKIINFLNLSCLHIPDVYDNIVSYVIQNSIGDNVIISLLKTCAKANYVPKRMPELLEIVKEVYKERFDDGSYVSNLSILNYLSILKIYPAKELQDFFSIDVIQELERIIEMKNLEFSKLEDTLMFLNRGVVVESPELNIPWFHSHYDKNPWLSNVGFKKNDENFNGEVYSALIEIFGSAKYIKRESLSPYFHKIDFECALDNYRNKPLSANILDNHSHKDFKRVAICIEHENSFCKNSKLLTGFHFMTKRQLEKMNYKVIEVPHFEWFSLGMSEKASKIEYLKRKIYDL